ncbi:MAG: DUF2442 domain-containing protein [Dysgonamonadaceae bacterium]|jgi:hypothetical protein|nr:DUF2442 domain-containing protein [Dysgonamonadaceae bacterium]
MKQNLTNDGLSTSVKVHAIVSNGITLEVKGITYFLPYNSNPWFENAKVADVFNVEMLGKNGIRWDALDVDLEIDSLMYPEKYPLIAKY